MGDLGGVGGAEHRSNVIYAKLFGHCTLSGEINGARDKETGWKARKRDGGSTEPELVRLCPTDDVQDQAPPTHMPPTSTRRTPAHSRVYAYVYREKCEDSSIGTHLHVHRGTPVSSRTIGTPLEVRGQKALRLLGKDLNVPLTFSGVMSGVMYVVTAVVYTFR